MQKKFDITTIKRLLSYMREYKAPLIISIIAIIINTAANIGVTLFLETLIDEYIVPLIGLENPVFTGLAKAVGIMSFIYLISIVTVYISSRMIVNVSEGVLKKIRDEMFIKMQKLPIKYFDTHTHGDIMSHYTNDTDTLSQMISQSLPQFFTSALTIIGVFIAMIISNLYLTFVVIISMIVMLTITKKIAGNSAKYFFKRQESVAKVNGYIEEMINGQKVVNVFCYEEKAKEKFDVINEELYEQTYQANKFANMLMPILIGLR